MPYHRTPRTSTLDETIHGMKVEMTLPAGLNVEFFYLERMMEAVGIPQLTVATAPELHRRILTWTYGPTRPTLDCLR
jgi:hypothetical protein